MEIIRTPLRISICGGGTDLPSFYTKYGSTFVSGAINKYIYFTYHRSKFDIVIRARYSIMEEAENIEDIKNEIIRETFKFCGIYNNAEITSHAEIPSGTGLGSSGSFGVGLLQALKPESSKQELAETATYIQMELLNYPIGKQDQYVAAYGGINVYNIDKNGKVGIEALQIDTNILQQRLVLFYTGQKRSANEVLITQKERSELYDAKMFVALKETQVIGLEQLQAFKSKNYDMYGKLLNTHWEAKKRRSPIMTNKDIDKWYKQGLKLGALGGKLIGAGGGGFLMFYTSDPQKLIKGMPLQHLNFDWDFQGSKILYQ